MDKSVGEIAELVGGAVQGDPSVRITGVNGIRQAKPGDLTFLGSAKYRPYLETTGASALLASDSSVAWSGPLIVVRDPYLAFVRVIKKWVSGAGTAIHPRGIHPTAVIGRNVKLGANVAVDAHVKISDDCEIGDGVVLYGGAYLGHGCAVGPGTVIYPNATLREGVRVGARCIIHAGAVLGTDGFGFAPLGGSWAKVPQVGAVAIGDDVEIGANTAVDRATFGTTVVGSGTKIDNLVQIAHNVEVGEHCVISGMTGIAGSTTIGRHVIIAAQAGIADHVEVGENATIAGRSGVVTTVKPGETVSGFPAIEHKTELRILAAMRRLPDLVRRLKELEQRVQDLEKQLYGKTTNDC